MRVFIAIDIDEEIRRHIGQFLEGVREFAPDARWARPESLHVTLKFIGEKPPPSVEEMKNALRAIEPAPMEIIFRGYGFFPTAKAPRVFWIGVESTPRLAELAAAVEAAMLSLKLPKEEHPFSPHLTLARAVGRSGAPSWRRGDRKNTTFQRLQDKLGALPSPEFGSMTSREFFLYKSQLSPSGSRYTKLARFGVGGD